MARTALFHPGGERKLPVEHCLKGTGRELARGVLGRPGEKIIDKPTFGYTGWGDMEFEKIEPVGLCTDICVVSGGLHPEGHVPRSRRSRSILHAAQASAPESHQAALLTLGNVPDPSAGAVRRDTGRP